MDSMTVDCSIGGADGDSVINIDGGTTRSKRSATATTSRQHRSNHRSHSHKARSVRGVKRDCGGGGGGGGGNMAPFQTAVTLGGNGEPGGGGGGQEVIEVEIVAQDDATWGLGGGNNGGDGGTVVGSDGSAPGGSLEELSLWPPRPPPDPADLVFPCSRRVLPAITALVTVLALLSPIAMIALPKLGFFPGATWGVSAVEQAVLLSCGAGCKGAAVGAVLKTCLLGGALWAARYGRQSRAAPPAPDPVLALQTVLTALTIITYWLFYIVQITEGGSESETREVTLEYRSLVSFASSMADTLLFVFFVIVILSELRHLRPVYFIKVVRSPDGESGGWAVGQMSIQKAALSILDRYYTEFAVYNPYLERLPPVSKSSKKQNSTFKYYDVVDNNSTLPHTQSTRSVISTHSRRRDSGHNDRFYEEHDYERRVRKRRARLLTAAEDAFRHIARTNTNNGNNTTNSGHHHHHTAPPSSTMDATEAAQAVFPSLARPLQKYLRVTRQQPRHTVDSILQHLAQCIAYDLSPRAFLERFLSPSPPVVQCGGGLDGGGGGGSVCSEREVAGWRIVCSEVPGRPLTAGTIFQLVQGPVSLYCTVHALPFVSLREDPRAAPMENDAFILRMNSETSV